MMGWLGVILILLVGWFLVFLEVFFLPGTTVFALIGSLTMAAGVAISFSEFGFVGGLVTLFGSVVFTFLSIVFGFKSGLLKGLTLRTQNKGKTNEIDETKIKIGDSGIAASKIAPIGKALFNDAPYEVQTLGEWIVEGTPVEVSKIYLNKIFVKAKT
jgi:membrane-bound ClpP family serine protease